MINCWTLNSGARLVAEEIPHVKSAAIGIYIKVGSRHEPPGINGASHFIEHMLFKGTEKRSAREIAESFEGIGGQLNAYTSKEYTCVYARTLDENVYMALDILFDMLFNSLFAERDFNTERNVIIEEINMYEDTPDDLIHDVFARQMWNKHPMGAPILGTLGSIASFDRVALYNFHKSCYVPSNMVISVAGNIDSQKIRDTIEGLSAGQPGGGVILSNNRPGPYEVFTNLVEKQTEQVQLCLGVPGISYNDHNRYTQNVMNSILGGGLSSRLFQTLREDLGLAYAVYSYPSNYSDTGSYSIYIGTGPNHIQTCFEALHKVIGDFVCKGIEQQELERVKKLMKSSIYLGLENVMNRMSRLGKAIMMYGKTHSPEEVIDKVNAVTTEMVKQFADQLLSEQAFSLAAIAPAEVLSRVDKEFQRLWRH